MFSLVTHYKNSIYLWDHEHLYSLFPKKFSIFKTIPRNCCDLCLLVGEGNGTPLQHSCLENSMARGAWWAAVHGVAKSRTWLSDFTLTFHFHALEKEMATHSIVLAWRIPGMGEPSGLSSLGSHRVGCDWSDLAAAAAAAAAGVGTRQGAQKVQGCGDGKAGPP